MPTKKQRQGTLHVYEATLNVRVIASSPAEASKKLSKLGTHDLTGKFFQVPDNKSIVVVSDGTGTDGSPVLYSTRLPAKQWAEEQGPGILDIA